MFVATMVVRITHNILHVLSSIECRRSVTLVLPQALQEIQSESVAIELALLRRVL